MITVHIPLAVANFLPATLILAFFGVCALGAIAAFIVSLIQQRRYETTALPDLGIEIPDDSGEAEDENETILESRFALDDDDEGFDGWDDEETNQIMRELNDLKNGSAPSKSSKSSIFGRKK